MTETSFRSSYTAEEGNWETGGAVHFVHTGKWLDGREELLPLFSRPSVGSQPYGVILFMESSVHPRSLPTLSTFLRGIEVPKDTLWAFFFKVSGAPLEPTFGPL